MHTSKSNEPIANRSRRHCRSGRVTWGVRLFCLLLFAPVSLHAGTSSPVGLWKNIDDVTGQPRSLIRILETNGEFHGVVEKGFPRPGETQNPKCVKCTGEKKDQPIIGMTMLWGLQSDGADSDDYTGGHILDPDNGKVYRCKIRVDQDAKTLHVRGYIGVSLLGRTQIWIRELEVQPPLAGKK